MKAEPVSPKTEAKQVGVPNIFFVKKIRDEYWESVGCPRGGSVFGGG